MRKHLLRSTNVSSIILVRCAAGGAITLRMYEILSARFRVAILVTIPCIAQQQHAAIESNQIKKQSSCHCRYGFSVRKACPVILRLDSSPSTRTFLVHRGFDARCPVHRGSGALSLARNLPAPGSCPGRRRSCRRWCSGTRAPQSCRHRSASSHVLELSRFVPH